MVTIQMAFFLLCNQHPVAWKQNTDTPSRRILSTLMLVAVDRPTSVQPFLLH